jgi:hypothetical protein
VNLDGISGLSVYLPLGKDLEDHDLPFYVNSQLALANDTLWDEFIFHALGRDYPPPQPPADSVGGRGNTPGPVPLPSEVFLPVVMRHQ